MKQGLFLLLAIYSIGTISADAGGICMSEAQSTLCSISNEKLTIVVEVGAEKNFDDDEYGATKEAEISAKLIIANLIQNGDCLLKTCQLEARSLESCLLKPAKKSQSRLKMQLSHITWSVICETEAQIRTRANWSGSIDEIEQFIVTKEDSINANQ